MLKSVLLRFKRAMSLEQHTFAKYSEFVSRECKCIPHRENKINFSANYVLINILEKLCLFHDSSQEEVVG